jgi:hypothetical protein
MNKLQRDQLKVRRSWEAMSDVLQGAIDRVVEDDNDRPRAAVLLSAAPDEVFDGPLPLGTLVHFRHGLPLSSRTAPEMIADYEIDAAFQASSTRSVERRTPPKHEGSIVIAALDGYDAMTKRIGAALVGNVMKDVDYQAAIVAMYSLMPPEQ